jgi:hypothetical protein
MQALVSGQYRIIMKLIFSILFLTITLASQASDICEEGINIANFETDFRLDAKLKSSLREGLISKGFHFDVNSAYKLEVNYNFTPPCRDKVNLKIIDTNVDLPKFDITSSRCGVGGASSSRLSNIEKIGIDILMEIRNCN